MSLPIYVDAYSGYKANERPRQLCLDEDTFEIESVEKQWRSPDATFFKVRTTDGKHFVLRYEERLDEWTLQSDLDGVELLIRWDLRAIFRFAHQDGLVDLNAGESLFTPGMPGPRSRNVLTAEQVQQIVSVLDLREQVVVRLAIFAGMRPGEIVGLQWKHVMADRFSARKLFARSSKLYCFRKLIRPACSICWS